ncbi:MAG TPA: M23 family peptidase [Verrucomicrobiales bacterium]|nr:M23 family peptidase [Verrucomicrobiales bacterium]
MPRLSAAILLCACATLHALDLRLPTDNDALLTGDGPAFFQFVDRDFEGRKSTPWEGGQFGFVRDARRVGSRVAFARFHEGMDIKPLRRDAAGNPLDEVRAILPGAVAHVSETSAHSNYGRYIVIRHDLSEGPFFSLYAHLGEIIVVPGERVQAGQRLARMGFTGAGIDQRRAHLHLELNILLSEQFPAWHAEHFRTPNHHGLYNGLNLLGLDIQSLYLARRKNPALTLGEFLRGSEAYFELEVPGAARMEILRRYPWLNEGGSAEAPSWKVRCTRWGFPVSVKPGSRSVATAVATWAREDPVPHYYNTRGLINNSGQITVEGLRFARLLCGF